MSVAAIIVAAGSGSRLKKETEADLPKQYLEIVGKTVLRRTVDAFRSHPEIGPIIIVIHPDFTVRVLDILADVDGWTAVNGATNRQASVLQGLEALEDAKPEKVLIHDAARPFIDSETISRVIEATETGIGAIAALPVVDTLKREDHGFEADTVDRTGVWRAQTPQAFMYDEIYKAHLAQENSELTDDAGVARAEGVKVKLVKGHENNFKITHADDLRRARALAGDQAMETRTGLGYDVHQITTDKSTTTLCGVEIDCGFGLSGHSDADVAMHALTDALLGAIGKGDIGDHFPPTDPQWKGAASHIFLNHACDLIREMKGSIVHVDVTIICEKPKVGPHRQAMKEKMADLMGLTVDRVSVKATTTEKLGFTGRGEGIAAQAIASVKLPEQV